jgi:hypothetical protein
MNVLFTIAVIAAAAMWALAVFTRLSKLRGQVTQAWKRLEADQSNEAVRTVYNKHVDMYNAALEAFPANVVGPAAGFKPARRFEP